MKTGKKLIALILATIMTVSALIVPVSANTDVTDKGEQVLYTVLDKAVDFLVNAIGALVISPRRQSIKDYKDDNFYPGLGKDDFLDEPAEGAAWSVGYANASIQDGKELDGEHFVGGSLSISKKVATKVLDDQKVRTVALSDGRGITIFSELDGFGITNKSVREIRSRFAEYAEKNKLNITSVNVGVLHQHSCVDIFGMNGDILTALFTAPFKNLIGQTPDSGINEEFMENLYNVTVNSMIEAVRDMKEGSLYYGSVNVEEFIRDKRDPQVFDTDLHRLRFVPADGSDETWIVEGGIHCVGLGAGGTVVTGDYPFYMEKYINSLGANFIYIEGAELALTARGDNAEPTQEETALDEDEGYGRLAALGRTFAQKLESIEEETEVEPVLNIAHKVIYVKITNAIFKFAAKFGLLTNEVVRDGLELKVVSELGYCEFGKNLAIAIIPGELAPEIAFGGAMTADDPLNWTGESWDYPTFESKTGGRKLLVFGLMDDQIGYILTDNNWHSIFTENEEIVSSGSETGSFIAEEYIGLVDSLK